MTPSSGDGARGAAHGTSEEGPGDSHGGTCGPAREGTLWLIRHGYTVVHGGGGVAGRTDVALSDEGRESVRALGASCGGVLRERVLASRWFVSPLGRTRDSAALLRDALETGDRLARTPSAAASGVSGSHASPSSDAAAEESARFAIDDRLVELDFGDWEGSTWEAVHRDHGEALAAWGLDWVSRGPPNGESFAEQSARCGAWFDEHVGDAPSAGTARARDALVVAHGGSIRALACRLLGWPLERAMRLAVDPGTACRFERDGRRDSGWRLVGANLGDFG